jgi:cytochrome o ubiquinol oxidase subunit 1
VAGVILAIPPADFQLHNSLFLVAHFHTMIIGGVVFGYLAGLTYWFPKFFGFKLNERLGRYAFYCWLSGFLLAFVPLYILGLMGATRRLDHYDPSLGWQQLFIVAGIGVAVIIAGIGFQILQLLVSLWQRKENVSGADPWDGRTLEWSTASPPPFYNYAVIPQVAEKDAFWAIKQNRKNSQEKTYESIRIPKNSGLPITIACLAFSFGFAMIWHMWWLAILGFLGIITVLIIRSAQDEHEYLLPAAKIRRLETEAAQ